ncbi:MAG: glycosyltransferase [Methylotenera sp.]|nr:glycosyltransferase [Methylotenera sp.]
MTQEKRNRLHILFFTAEQWPTFRPDLIALFGKYLPRYGVTSDLVTEKEQSANPETNISWPGGEAIVCNVPSGRAGQYLVKLMHSLRNLITIDANKYDAIQVRDMSFIALVALCVAKLKGIPFFYWLSYPQSEGQIDRARSRGIRGGMRFWFPLIQGMFGKWVLYRIVFPRADHIFVQSRQMQKDIASYGIPMYKMTPVPMGVDTEIARPESIQPSIDAQLVGRKVVVYLGTLDPIRQIDVLLHMLVHVRKTVPDILLVLVGDTTDRQHREWLKNEADRLGVSDLVYWTGWLDATVAWQYVRSAEVGLSPIPRGYLLDMGSPTKAVEYMALGLPVLVNDNPDQFQVVSESGAGVCVKLEPLAFSESLVNLLADENLRRSMGENGQRYVIKNRTYDRLAAAVATKYASLVSSRGLKYRA